MHPQSLLTERILNIELVYEPVFDLLSALALIRFAGTCRTAHHAVASYSRLAFNIDRLLARFFPSSSNAGYSSTYYHPHLQHDEQYARARAFRSLQARTGTLVSGSAALQFFDRQVWAESDLDLYVHVRHRREVARWLVAEGFTYKPTEFQDPRLEVEVTECLAKRPNGIYSMPGVLAIFSFVKTKLQDPVDDYGLAPDTQEEDRSPRELKVQIIVAKNAPMECVFGFHSTCVMNVISYEKAYCLFPRATLEERRTLVSSSSRGKIKHNHKIDGLYKYHLRGWHVAYTLRPDEVVLDLTDLAHDCTPTHSDALTGAGSPSSPSSSSSPTMSAQRKQVFPLGWRWIDDSSSWVIPLSLDGVTPPPAMNTSTRALTHDPVAVCNWEVRYSRGQGVIMHFEVAAGKVLRYRYLVTDEQLLVYLGKVLSARAQVEKDKARLELEDWTYHDEELPSICRDFLHGLADRRLSSLRM